MALVDYASSSDEDVGEKDHGTPPIESSTSAAALQLKRKRVSEGADDLPPLPTRFHDLYASTTRASTRDDPSLHGGRKRATPHIEGNWPTHLYVEWCPTAVEQNALSKLISKLKETTLGAKNSSVHSFLTSDLGSPLPLHISLSRPIGFSTDQKDDIVSSLEAVVKTSGIRPFDVSFTGLDWVANFEKTRWFLVLRVQKPECDGLNRLLHVCNSTVQNYGQPPLYAKPMTASVARIADKNLSSRAKNGMHHKKELRKAYWATLQDCSNSFHTSIAWTLGSPGEDLLDATKDVSSDALRELAQMQINICEIKAKVGNTVTNIPLHLGVQEGKSLFGF